MAKPTRQALVKILHLLRKEYGEKPPKRWGGGVEVLIETILSQNTSNANSQAGYRQLRRRFKSWKQVTDAPVEEVERHIRVSGLSKQKAPRIQTILKEIRDKHGKIDLQFLEQMEDRAAYDYLVAFNGIGAKTASCTLLFAFGKQLFPVDTHIHRISIRLGLIPEKTTADQAHDLLTPLIEPKDRYETHVLLIEHGRKTCKAGNPRCDECVLLKLCPTGKARTIAD